MFQFFVEFFYDESCLFYSLWPVFRFPCTLLDLLVSSTLCASLTKLDDRAAYRLVGAKASRYDNKKMEHFTVIKEFVNFMKNILY